MYASGCVCKRGYKNQAWGKMLMVTRGRKKMRKGGIYSEGNGPYRYRRVQRGGDSIRKRKKGRKKKTKKRSPAVERQPDSPKYGGDLLSQLVCQYHRRARA